MTRHDDHRTGSRLAGAAVLFLCSAPVVCWGDTIYSLKSGAICRDSSGAVLQPHASPPATPFPADKTPLGMIVASAKINGEDCYLYVSEVGLAPPQGLGADACPDAAIAGDRLTVAGTRSIGRGNCR